MTFLSAGMCLWVVVVNKNVRVEEWEAYWSRGGWERRAIEWSISWLDTTHMPLPELNESRIPILCIPVTCLARESDPVINASPFQPSSSWNWIPPSRIQWMIADSPIALREVNTPGNSWQSHRSRFFWWFYHRFGAHEKNSDFYIGVKVTYFQVSCIAHVF